MTPRALIGALFVCLLVMVAGVPGAEALSQSSPSVTSLDALGAGRVAVGWSGVSGEFAKIKRDDYRLDPYGSRWYIVANTGAATLVGLHFYRVCGFQGSRIVCSSPRLVTVR
jgi:hypothetical protein